MSTVFRYYLTRKAEHKNKDRAYYIGTVSAADGAAAEAAVLASPGSSQYTLGDDVVLEVVPDVRYVPLTARPIASGTADNALVAATPGLRLFRLTIYENNSSTASLYIRNGVADTASIVEGLISLTSGQQKVFEYGPNGVDVSAGLYVDRVSGTTAGVALTFTQS